MKQISDKTCFIHPVTVFCDVLGLNRSINDFTDGNG